MKVTKKIVNTGSLLLAGAMLLSVFPVMTLAKPAIEVITHAGAGGGTDVNSRMMMIRTRRTLKQDMVVVNKRGGGGAAAMNYFKTRPADGNTIMTFTVGHAITMAKGKTSLTVDDMSPIARGTNDPQILMVNCKTSPYKTPEAFVAGMRNGDKRSNLVEPKREQSTTLRFTSGRSVLDSRCRLTSPSRVVENWRPSLSQVRLMWEH